MFQPVSDPVAGSLVLSALVAALPLVTLFVLLGGLRWKAWQAGLASLAVALGVAVFAFGMPAGQAMLAASEGAAFGLFPIIWIVLTAIWIFRLTELTGYDLVLRRAFGTVSPDHRVQAILIAFCFGALLEALAGFGTPVAVTAVMLIAVGLRPLKASAVALVANTAPVAFGAIAVPITTLAKITGLDADTLGAMVGRQTPVLAAVVPLVLVFMVDGRRGLRQAWLPATVAGLAFAVAQFVSANFISYQITDILAAVVGALAVVLLLRVWQPPVAEDQTGAAGTYTPAPGAPDGPAPSGGEGGTVTVTAVESVTGTVTARRALMAFAPYLVVVVLFTLVSIEPFKTFVGEHSGWKFAWPGLAVAGADGAPLGAATFNFNLFSAAGTTLLVAGVITAALLRVRAGEAARALVGVVVQFRFTILTVVAVLALAYVMNFSGQTVTLGLALASTGGFFAFLSPVVGWIGVAVTGSDTSSNSLFGLLQTTAAEQTGISPYLLAAANTSGGVLGKMISPQNLAIAAAVVGMEGRESLLFRRVVGWSLGLLLVMCLLVLLQSTPVLGWMVVS
ncbi:MAG: L-lactate permease [Actinomycetales bacterium]|nr:L-lactate permease [Actinomycetales bacterium]